MRNRWLLWLMESIFYYNGITLMYVYSIGIWVVIIIVWVFLLLPLHAIYLFDSSPHKTVWYGSSILRWMLAAQSASFILPQVPLGVQPGDSLGRGGNYGEWVISTNIIKLHDVHKSSQGLYSLSRHVSYRKISQSLEAARFGFGLFQSLWNLTLRCL